MTEEKFAYTPTTTLDGEYVSVFEGGQGLDFESKAGVRLNPTIRKVVGFKRASDGVIEIAWTTPSYYTQHEERTRKRLTAKANISLGRYRSYLSRTGERYEVNAHLIGKAEERRKRREFLIRNAKKAEGEAMYDLLLAIVSDHDVDFKDEARSILDRIHHAKIPEYDRSGTRLTKGATSATIIGMMNFEEPSK